MLLDSYLRQNGLLGLGGLNNGLPQNSLLGNLYDPAQARAAKFKSFLTGAAASLLGQGPSATPITFGTSLSKGLAGGFQQAQQAGQDYMQNVMTAQQLKRQQGLDASQKQLTDFQIQGAQRDANNAAAFNTIVNNIQDPIEKAAALRDPAGWSAKYLDRKYGPNRQWTTIGHDNFGMPTYGWTPAYQGPAQGAAPQQPSAAINPAFSQPSPQGKGGGAPGGQGVVAFGDGAATPQPGAVPGQPQQAKQPDVTDLHGEDFLNALAAKDPGLSAQVRAIVEGRAPYPTGMSARSPRGQMLAEYAQQADPTLNYGTAPARAQMQKDISTGKLGQTNNALNTSIGHLMELSDAAGGLDNYHSGTGSSVQNYLRDSYQRFAQNPNFKTFDTVRNAVAGEVVKAYRGAGGAEADIQQQLALISSANSPEELNSAIAETAKLLGSKIEANQNQYDSTMGPLGPKKQMVDDKSQKSLQTLLDRANGQTTSQTGNPALSQSDYAVLPKGAQYTAPDGSVRIKQ